MSLLSFVMPSMFGESVQGIKLLFSNSRMVQISHRLVFLLLTWINRRSLSHVAEPSEYLTWRTSILFLVMPLIGCFEFCRARNNQWWHCNQPRDSPSAWNVWGRISNASPAEEWSVRKGIPVAHLTGAYPVFCSMKRVGVFLLPTKCDTGTTQGYPSA